MSKNQKQRVELLLAERISLAGICRVMEIEAHQLYTYMDELYAEVPADLSCTPIQSAGIELYCLDYETDELWSFVLYKANKQWLWLALDRANRQVIALHLVD